MYIQIKTATVHNEIWKIFHNPRPQNQVSLPIHITEYQNSLSCHIQSKKLTPIQLFCDHTQLEKLWNVSCSGILVYRIISDFYWCKDVPFVWYLFQFYTLDIRKCLWVEGDFTRAVNLTVWRETLVSAGFFSLLSQTNQFHEITRGVHGQLSYKDKCLGFSISRSQYESWRLSYGNWSRGFTWQLSNHNIIIQWKFNRFRTSELWFVLIKVDDNS